MNIKQEVIFDSGTIDMCFSIRKQLYIEINGQKHYIKNEHDEDYERKTFNPTELNNVKEFAPELYDTLAKLWTPEVIAAWEQKQTEVLAQI